MPTDQTRSILTSHPTRRPLQTIRRLRAIHPRLAATLVASTAALAVAGAASTQSASAQTGTVTQPAASGGNVPIELPSTLGGFEDFVASEKASGFSRKALPSLRASQARVESATVAAYERAYGGAPAAYRAYSNADLLNQPYVIAVRAPSPGMVVGPIFDTKFYALATPPKQVIDSGQVQCEIDWMPTTPAGHHPKPSTELIADCQRSDPDLTVFTGGGGFKGPKGLARAVAFTNAAFTAAAR